MRCFFYSSIKNRIVSSALLAKLITISSNSCSRLFNWMHEVNVLYRLGITFNITSCRHNPMLPASLLINRWLFALLKVTGPTKHESRNQLSLDLCKSRPFCFILFSSCSTTSTWMGGGTTSSSRSLQKPWSLAHKWRVTAALVSGQCWWSPLNQAVKLDREHCF